MRGFSSILDPSGTLREGLLSYRICVLNYVFLPRVFLARGGRDMERMWKDPEAWMTGAEGERTPDKAGPHPRAGPPSSTSGFTISVRRSRRPT